MTVLTSPKAQGRLKQRGEHRRAQEDADIIRVMSEPHGRRVIWRLLRDSGVWSRSFTGSASATDFNEGRRSVGLDLMEVAQKLCAPEYLTMLTESIEASRDDEAYEKSARDAAKDDDG